MAVRFSREEAKEIFYDLDHYPNYEINLVGDVRNKKTGRFLKQELVSGGYLRVEIQGDKIYVHKLVGEMFVRNPFHEKYIVHENKDKTDNYYGNLLWSNTYIYKHKKNPL